LDDFFVWNGNCRAYRCSNSGGATASGQEHLLSKSNTLSYPNPPADNTSLTTLPQTQRKRNTGSVSRSREKDCSSGSTTAVIQSRPVTRSLTRLLAPKDTRSPSPRILTVKNRISISSSTSASPLNPQTKPQIQQSTIGRNLSRLTRSAVARNSNSELGLTKLRVLGGGGGSGRTKVGPSELVSKETGGRSLFKPTSLNP